MKHNSALPDITVDPETFVVVVDGVELKVEPADHVCMAKSFYLF